MPAWQKRHPRVQPRRISTFRRSCTSSANGTTVGSQAGEVAKSFQMRFTIFAGTSVFRAHPCACLLCLVLIKHIVERRHIAALKCEAARKKLSARRARLLHFPMKNEQFGKRFFAFAQQKHVEKR